MPDGTRSRVRQGSRVYLEGQGDLVGGLRTLISHIETLDILIINLATRSLQPSKYALGKCRN